MKPIRKHFIAIVAIAASALMIPASQAEEEKETPVKGTIAVKKGMKEAELAALAKVPLGNALGIASGAAPGKAFKAELESEDGFLVWEVEIAGNDQKTHEVTVDAGTGQILKNEIDEEDDEKEGDDDDEKK